MVVAVANAAAVPTAITAADADADANADSPVSVLEDEVICSSKTSVLIKSLGPLHFPWLGAMFEFRPIRFSSDFGPWLLEKKISIFLP